GRRRIIEDVFRKKRANLLLAFAGRKPAGYAFYFYTYSTFLALPTFYLEDIFVDAEFRRKGLGLALFLKCVSEAYKNNCGRFEFAVLTWNKNAIKFYEKFGARKLKEWYSYRMTRNTIERLAKTKVQSRKQRFRPF
ncbi:MAG: GNAT family N-acetyltransferase, partial [Nitrososphaerota archaeon]|nr:GNAT family N-acetyltransferase [Nitrososphaerota archaeon]